jgi:hypothetical protein
MMPVPHSERDTTPAPGALGLLMNRAVARAFGLTLAGRCFHRVAVPRRESAHRRCDRPIIDAIRQLGCP